MNAYTIRSIDMYMSEEDESLESGYAPRYLVDKKLEEGKFHNVEKIPFKEQFEQLEKKFHDVVHSLVFEGIHLVVFAGTPLGMITWIILSYFSRLFFTAVQKRTKRAKEPKRKSMRRRAEVRRQHKTMFLVVLVYSNLEAAKGMEDALQRLAEINQQTLQGIQTLAEEMRSSAAAGTARHSKLQQYTAGNSAAECRGTAHFASSTGNSSDNFRGDRKQPRESSEGKKAR